MMVEAMPKDFWDAKLREGKSWHEWPDEHLVRMLATRYPKKSHLHVLELGYGGGNNLWFLKDYGFQITGLDVSVEAMKQTLTVLGERGITMTMGSLQLGMMQEVGTIFQSEQFDVVVEVKALQHLNWDDHWQVLGGIDTILKPGGRFYTKHLLEQTSGAEKEHEVSPYCYDVQDPKAAFPFNGLTCMPNDEVYSGFLKTRFIIERELCVMESNGETLASYTVAECQKC